MHCTNVILPFSISHYICITILIIHCDEQLVVTVVPFVLCKLHL